MTPQNLSVHVDLNMCEGHALCAQLAPDIFELNDDDAAVAIDENPGVEHETSVRAAVAACPRQAITVGTTPVE